MKTIIAEGRDVLRQAADAVSACIAQRPDAVLALGANDDCLALYRLLSDRCREKILDLSHARFFAVSEFVGLAAGDPRSCRAQLREALLAQADPAGERSFFLNEDTLEGYDAVIAAQGGIDLAILGVGERGRIGFNEPATPFDSLSHRQKLTMATKRELADLFGAPENVPGYGLTLGIHTLLGARQIVLAALGEQRADPVFRMLYARTDSFVPAAFLQLPLQVSVFLDTAAAAKL